MTVTEEVVFHCSQDLIQRNPDQGLEKEKCEKSETGTQGNQHRPELHILHSEVE